MDVRDVSDCVIKAMTAPTAANKRYVCIAQSMNLDEISSKLRSLFPLHSYNAGIPNLITKSLTPNSPEGVLYVKVNIGKTFRFNTSAIERDLGIKWRSTEETFVDMGKQLLKEKKVPLMDYKLMAVLAIVVGAAIYYLVKSLT